MIGLALAAALTVVCADKNGTLTSDCLPGGPYAAVCRTPSCGGPATPPLATPEPYQVTTESTARLMMGGIDSRGIVRPILVDDQDRVICSTGHRVRYPRVSNHGYGMGVYTGASYDGAPTVQVDLRGRVICGRHVP